MRIVTPLDQRHLPYLLEMAHRQVRIENPDGTWQRTCDVGFIALCLHWDRDSMNTASIADCVPLFKLDEVCNCGLPPRSRAPNAPPRAPRGGGPGAPAPGGPGGGRGRGRGRAVHAVPAVPGEAAEDDDALDDDAAVGLGVTLLASLFTQNSSVV